MSYSVLRRYTPPTCTLEILAKNSPLSRWAGQPVLKDVRFNLNLDDPTLPKEQWTTVQGNRPQLEALCETVQNYVQSLLEQSHIPLGEARSTPEARQTAAVGASVATAPPLVLAAANPSGISLRPAGVLSHDLTLGSLAPTAPETIVRLSTLQLFDLANALDEYTTELLALPTLNQRRPLRKPGASWAQIAAALLLTVGVSATLLKLVGGTPATVSNAPTGSQGASSSDQRIANQLPPASTSSGSATTLAPERVPALPPVGSLQLPAPPSSPTVTVPKDAPKTTVTPGTAPNTQAGANRNAQTGTTLQIPTGQTPAGKKPTGSNQPNRPILSEERGAIATAPPSVRPNTAPPLTASVPSSAGANDLAQGARLAAPAAPAPESFDIPQVAEARNYIRERWKPREGLTQTLEYRLEIDATGAIQMILPLGDTASRNLEYTGLPPRGEAFVSPLRKGTLARIRLVLSPDGGVQTFLESLE